ncbi:MAG TPA: DNA polymerase domain-containing protein [Thermoplasmata archaeon]|nr:DNA polymerase domain-containing protein [Thermoplasmata archaeon]
MTGVDLFVLGGSYRAYEDGVVVELYAKDRAGESLVVRYYGFRPYFQLTEANADQRQRLSTESEVVEQRELTRWVRGSDRSVLQISIQHPWTVPSFRERYRREGEEGSVLACDIPFVHRFLYDKGLGLTVHCEVEDEPAEVRALYTVPRVVRAVTSPTEDIRPASPFRPPLTYLAFDIENAIKERTIFTLCGVIDRNGAEESFRFSGDERHILESFIRKVVEADPDVITGYNIGGYDFPLLIERAQALGIPGLPLGRDRGPTEDAGQRLWRIHGRIVADAWWTARRDLRPKQESLDYVAQVLLGDKKLDVDRRNIAEEWKKDPEAVMKYCEHDARLALRILQKLRAMDKAADLATVAHLPLEEGLNGRTSLFIDALLVPRADRRSIGVPPTHRTGRDAPIEGGYVHSIRPGLFPWVVVLDFKAMYPSIIIAKNLCFTTLSPEGPTVAPSGARFLTVEQRRGVIPEILQELLQARDDLRQQGRAAPTEEGRQYYDGLQAAVKVLMNSFYGVLASSFYRFTNKDIGAAITSFARDQITTIIRELEADHHEVVYSDTDSVFVKSPVPTLEGSKAFGQELARRFTAKGVTFEFQSVYEALFSHGAKKRYVGRTVWPKEELVIRGYESRRTDAFDYQVEALNEVFDLVLKGNPAVALTRARELVAQVQKEQVPPERLVVARSVRAEGDYNESTRDGLPFLRAFKQLQAEGYDVIPGMKVAWIVTNASRTPQEIEPWMSGRPFTKKPDYGYYAERVAQTLARVTEVYDWDADMLLQGRRQQKLIEPASPAGPLAASATPPVGLDTPIGDLGSGGPRKRKITKTLAAFDEVSAPES